MPDLLTPILLVAVAAAGFLAWKLRQARVRKDAELSEVRSRYGSLIDADAELTNLRSEADRFTSEKASEAADYAIRQATLKEEYRAARSKYEEIQSEVKLLEENLEDISFGVYKPHFSFQTSEQYKEAMNKARDRARHLVRGGMATCCHVQWTVGESRKDGERMVKQYTKLQLRAFNGECEAALANVSWNNIAKMEERVHKSFAMINTLGDVMKVSITGEYLEAKTDELRLAHEYEQKKYDEREELRRIRQELREEEKAQQEFESARIEAEKEEERYQKALDNARKEAAQTTGVQLNNLAAKIASLEAKIDDARNKKERAIARAELTKSGFVYVISNLGSFGDKVYKIGMTRRMEPMERIAELGDASVPFAFDLHVMLYSDNAPELEAALHAVFEGRRVNKVNRRKEFYRDIELEAVESFVKQRGLSAQFLKVAEAKEYRETLALVEAQKEVRAAATEVSERFPDDPFAQAATAAQPGGK